MESRVNINVSEHINFAYTYLAVIAFWYQKIASILLVQCNPTLVYTCLLI